jgi:peptide/nickel transport system substrate-binding protein
MTQEEERRMRKLTACLMGTAIALGAPAWAQNTEVTIALNEELDVVDPCMASRSNIGRVILQNVSETLTELNPTDGSLMPRLAESWEQVDDDTWRFHLRQGVKFGDGSDFGADDVKHSIERTLSTAISCEIGAKFFGGMTITPEVVDAATIDITSDPAQPILPLLFSTMTMVPAETPVEFTRNPVGTGPYEFTSYEPGVSIVLTRRDDYWGEQPAVTKATYVFRTDDAVRAAMVAAGEADIAPLIAETDATNPATDFSYPNSETTYLRIDVQRPPLDDMRVRQALNYAVDRDAFLGTLIAADAVKATHMTPPSALGVQAIEPFAFDLEKAKALVAEAKAAGTPVDTEIQMVCRIGNFANVTEVCEALQQMFAEAGLNVRLDMTEVAEWTDIYSRPFEEARAPQLVMAMHDNNRGDPVFSMYFKYACEGLQSAGCDPETDKLIADATAAVGDARGPAWTAVFQKAWDGVNDVFLFHMVGFSRVSERLDFTPTISTNSELQLSQIKFK